MEKETKNWFSSPWHFFGVITAILSILSFLIVEIYSLDVWWQITIGTDILRTLEIPTVDKFSVAGMGCPYHDSHWLFQVVLAGFHEIGDMIGVQFLVILIWALTLFAVYRSTRFWTDPTSSAILTFLGAMASIERFLPRPETVSILMVSVFFNYLQSGRFKHWRGLLALMVFQAIWANSHGLFVIGPFLVGTASLGMLLNWWPDRNQGLTGAIKAVFPLVAVVAATFATPFGLAGWKYAYLLFHEVGSGAPEVMQTLSELSPTFGVATMSAPAFWSFLILAIFSIGGTAYLCLKRRWSPRLPIILVMFAVSFTGRRNITFLAMVAAPVIAEAFNGFIVGFRWKKPLTGLASASMLLWAIFPISGYYYLYMEIPARFGLGASPSHFPHGVTKLLDQEGFAGPILNSNTLGGFVTYGGYPQRLPLTDGRWEIYEETKLQMILNWTRDGVNWRSVADQYGTQLILLAHSSPEAKAIIPSIKTDNKWRLSYLDAAASLWVRNDVPGFGAVKISPENLPAVPRKDDALILHGFLGAFGDRELEALNLTRVLSFGGPHRQALNRLGHLQIELKRFIDAEKTFWRLLADDPGNAGAMNEMAFLAHQRGDIPAALYYIKQAVIFAPDNENYKTILARLLSIQAEDLPR